MSMLTFLSGNRVVWTLHLFSAVVSIHRSCVRTILRADYTTLTEVCLRYSDGVSYSCVDCLHLNYTLCLLSVCNNNMMLYNTSKPRQQYVKKNITTCKKLLNDYEACCSNNSRHSLWSVLSCLATVILVSAYIQSHHKLE